MAISSCVNPETRPMDMKHVELLFLSPSPPAVRLQWSLEPSVFLAGPRRPVRLYHDHQPICPRRSQFLYFAWDRGSSCPRFSPLVRCLWFIAVAH